jgi:DNA polymerase (family 10)
LHGVELNIGRDGELDYDPEFRSSFDWCLASVHDHFDLDRAAQTRRVVTRDARPVRAHDRPPLRAHDRRPPADRPRPRRVLAAAEATGTALEINGALPRLDLSVEALRRARARDVTFVLTSDAHHARELERVRLRGAQRRARVGPARARRQRWPAERLAAWATQKKAS